MTSEEEENHRGAKTYAVVAGGGRVLDDDIPFRELSTKFGRPAVILFNVEIAKISLPYKHTLIFKFFSMHFPVANIQKCLSNWGVKGGATIIVIDRRHVLVRFNLQEDFTKIYTREKCVMRGQMVKVFRWLPWFRPGMESSYALVWVAMPGLPHYYYKPGFIKMVAKAFGSLLSIATPTSTGSTAVCAHFCVEMDLSKEYPTEIYMGMDSKGGFQPTS